MSVSVWCSVPDGGGGGATLEGKLTRLITDSWLSSEFSLGGSSLGKGMLSGRGMFWSSSMLSIWMSFLLW